MIGPLQNLAPVTRGVLWRSAQPRLDALITLADLGVRRIYRLNDTGAVAVDDESRVAAASLIEVELDALATFAPEMGAVAAIVGMIRADVAAGVGVCVHCEHGRDRTGLVIGAYRLLVSEWTLDQALAERALFGTNALIDLADSAILDVLRQIAGK